MSTHTPTPEPPSTTHVLTAPATAPISAAARTRLADNVPNTISGKFFESIRYIRGRGALEIGLITLVVTLGFCIAAVVAPDSFPFLDPANLQGVIFQSIPVYAILAIGTGILMIAGEFDLSLGANFGLSAIVFVHTANVAGWVAGFFAALATGTAIALINGLVVVITKIPSFIATLGLGFFWTGMAFVFNGTMPAILSADGTTTTVFAGDLGFVRSQLIWLTVIGVTGWLFLHRHKTGNAIFAVGGNAAAAKAISINPARIKLLSFALLGALVAIAGVITAVRTTSIQPGTTDTYTLMSVAGAVVGGCSLNGGRGSIIGMVIGAALIQLIQDGLILANAPGFYVQLFVGLLIVVAAVANKLFEGKAS
ncbi:ABC transporter permease [Leifsonia sp. 21MFCrub1.1]|uniref:ABC transporter permease n=1 Tax=Leifsonia sp. 21MFCrub1.1 TaxID=1798223 RepID=UPI0008927EE8|nr:ABC transporter permease [Leifsonia sp. 21MFCrub1.1]SEB08149.1 monosaccharide ABC transporter membrane protein, CUT2 family [Leifsonia sp. 21MFCrub1.1]